MVENLFDTSVLAAEPSLGLESSDVEWIRARISRQLGGASRRLLDTDDMLQETLVKVVRFGPRFKTANHAQFRALLAKIAENVMVDAHRRGSAKKRAPVDAGAFGESVVDLDAVSRAQPGLVTEVDKNERVAWLGIAMQFLSKDDRALVQLRYVDGEEHAEVARAFEISEDAARKRARKAFERLARMVRRLQTEGVANVLAEVDG